MARAKSCWSGSASAALALIMLGLHLSYASLILCGALLGLANSVYHPADYAILSAHMDEARMGRAFLHPHLRRLPRRRGGARDHRGAGGNRRRQGRTDRGRRARPAGGAGAGGGGPAGCARRAEGGWHRGAEAERADAGDHRADVLLHAARAVVGRHRQFRRGGADERLWRCICDRQSGADLFPRRQRGRRARRRLPRRPHRAPRPGGRRLLCDQCCGRAGHRRRSRCPRRC